MASSQYREEEKREMQRAMSISLAIGFFLLLVKGYAWWLTGSTAILSDAAESVVHMFAVGFAAYSLRLSLKPADANHTYGHDRIAFFSAGFEGALIIMAAGYIAYQAIKKLIFGVTLHNLEEGMGFIVIATVINGFLGLFLVRQGKKFHSLVLEADGRHILTDCMTSLGVIIALLVTRWTGIMLFDPLLALLIAANILWTGSRLIRNAVSGLMDQIDPKLDAQVRALLTKETEAYGLTFHHLRHRNAGTRLLIEVHLLFPEAVTLAQAHEIATSIEKGIEMGLPCPTEVVTHLEPLEGHDEFHSRFLGHPG